MHLRRTALRLLSSPSTSFLSKPRSITSLTPSGLRIPRQSTRVVFQRRWATGEAEAKDEDESPPISELQPTAQEEVENAIHSDNAAEDATPGDAQARSGEQSALRSAIDTATETAANAASAVTGAAQSTASAVMDSGRSQGEGRGRTGQLGDPKPTIYIGNLFFDVTENDLVKELARFGTIMKCRLMRDARGLSKGFGYVDFETTEQATKAIAALNQQLFEGRRLAVQYAAYESKAIPPRGGGGAGGNYAAKPLNPPSKTLFIGNMSFEMTDRDLNNLFKGIRNVIDVRVAIDRRTGQPRGFAHADFVDVKSAMEAMKHLEGKETYGRKLRMDYSYGPSNAPKNQGGDDGPHEGL